MELTIKNLVHVIDLCNVPFTARSLCKAHFDDSKLRSIGAMVRHVEKQGVIEKVGTLNGAALFWRVDGKSAAEMHSEYRYQSNKTRNITDKTVRRKYPVFHLGDVKMKHTNTRYFPNSWELRSCGSLS